MTNDSVLSVESARRLVGGVVMGRVAAIVAVLGLVVAGCAADESTAPDPLDTVPSSAGADQTTTASSPESPQQPGDSPMEDVDVAPVVLVEPEPFAVPGPFSDMIDDGLVIQTVALESWNGGFLAIGEVTAPRPLPAELPPEIAQQFPPVISELFPDGLPATLDEAWTIIDDAGLREEAIDAVQAIPGAYDAIFSIEPPPLLFTWSADGMDWEQLEATTRDTVPYPLSVATEGDRLVIVGYESGTLDVSRSELVVAETTDLIEWNTFRIEPTRPPDLPIGTDLMLAIPKVVANDLGLMIQANVMISTDSAEARGMPENPSPQLEPYLRPGDWGPYQVPSHWFGPWGEPPAVTDPTGEGYPTGDKGTLAATNTGFIHLTDTVRYSDDGSTWTTPTEFRRTRRPSDIWTTFNQPLPDGVALYVDGPPTMFRVSDDATTWQPLDIPDLPADLAPAQVSDSDNYVLDTNNWSGTISQWMIASADGTHWIADHFSDVPAESDMASDYVVRIAALHGNTLLVGHDPPATSGLPPEPTDATPSTSNWWLHTFPTT